MITQYEYHILSCKYPLLLLPHTGHEMFLVICELIDKMSGSLGGDHDCVDCVIGDRLNKVIARINKGSKATFNKPPPKLSAKTPRRILMPPHYNANFQQGPKVSIKVRLACMYNKQCLQINPVHFKSNSWRKTTVLIKIIYVTYIVNLLQQWILHQD